MEVDEETRKEYFKQIQRLVWKDMNQRIMKAREAVLARRNNEVNQGASTSTANPSCNIPSSDEWLTYYPCLFDSIACSKEDDDDQVNCSQSSEDGHVAISMKLVRFLKKTKPEEPPKELEFESISSVLELCAETVENNPEKGSPSNGSILFIDMDRQPSSPSDSEWFPGTKSLNRRTGETLTPSPENRANRQGFFKSSLGETNEQNIFSN